MSHATVAVFSREGQFIDDLLEPYNENLEVEPYLSKTRQEVIDYIRKYRKGYDTKTDQECLDAFAKPDSYDEEGNYWSTYNPNSKWDWWQIGGRWSGMLKVGNDYCDDAYVRDIDFSPDKEIYKNALREWEVIVERAEREDGEDIFSLYKPEYYIEYFGDKETYAKSMSQFSTHAVITPDGVWHEVGEVGWFGVSSETPEESRDWYLHYKERFIDTADPDWKLTIIDYHI